MPSPFPVASLSLAMCPSAPWEEVRTSNCTSPRAFSAGAAYCSVGGGMGQVRSGWDSDQTESQGQVTASGEG